MADRLSHLNAAKGGRACLGCGTPLTGKRGDSTTCSDRCRKRLSRSEPATLIATPVPTRATPFNMMHMLRDHSPELHRQLMLQLHKPTPEQIAAVWEVHAEHVSAMGEVDAEQPMTLQRFMSQQD